MEDIFIVEKEMIEDAVRKFSNASSPINTKEILS